MARLKVIYISNESGLGGAGQSLLDMIIGLKDYVEPIVIVPSSGVLVDFLEKRAILYYIIPFCLAYGKKGSQSNKSSDYIFKNNYEAALKIADIILEQKIQLVHSNSMVVNVGAMAALLTDTPHIWHLREFVEEDFNCELYDMVLKQELFKYTNAFISISQCIKLTCFQKYGIVSQQIYDGINTERYKKELATYEKHNKYFLLVGRLQTGKGQWDAIKAIEILSDNGEDEAHLVIIGDGSRKYTWGMKQYVKEKGLTKYICFKPAQKDLSEFREKCTFSLTTSKMEALGRVTIEAMLAGNIVVGANTGGTLEIVGDNQEHGYLYQQGNPIDLANVMRKAMESKCMHINELRKKAQEYAMYQFNLNNYSKQIANIYENVLKKDEITRDSHKENFILSLRKRYENIKARSIHDDILSTNQVAKWRNLFLITDKWLEIRQNGYSLETYFIKHNLKKIAIYGMGYLGCTLYTDLYNRSIKIKYIIERDGEEIKDVLNVISPESEFSKVDAIVVTVLEEENRIKKYLERKTTIKIVKISNIIKWMENLVL